MTNTNQNYDNLVKLHLFVYGKVQKVSYRGYAAGQAATFGLSGWIRNRHNGSVEMVIVGPLGRVIRLLPILWQGPPLSEVNYIKIIALKEVKADDFEGKFKKKETI